jgi:mannan endo-1,4-beta-mannosidase
VSLPPRPRGLSAARRPHPPLPAAAPAALSRRRLVLGAGLTAAAVALGDVATGVAASAATVAVPRTAPGLTMTSLGILQRGGVTFRAGGVNAFQLITNDYPTPRLMTHAQIDALLAQAVGLGVGVVRAHTLAASVGKPFTLVRGVSGTGAVPRITYDAATWATIDYAVWKAGQLGIYLIAPFVDELGYYHGGKRHWVNFRRPGTVSLDPAVTSASSPAQRQAENAFYTDRQVNWDFEQYIRDWLTHVNPLTGLAFKDDPTLSVVQIGNELWTAAQDAPGWVAEKAALIKGISPRTLVMDSGADGLAVESMAWGSSHVDILETHPYSVFGAADVARMARFAASKGKAFAVGEYAWSKPNAPAIEQAVRDTGNVFTSALWSLQNDGDRHNEGAAYGGDDVSFRLRISDATQQAAVARITSHDRWLTRSTATA